MKARFVGFVLILGFLASIIVSGVAFGQSTRCVVVDRRDNVATVNCGGSTQTVNLGGTADRYRVGDSISRDTISQQSGGERRGGAKR